MRDGTRQGDAPSARPTSLLVLLVALLVAGAVAVLGAERTLDRVRVDTAVEAAGQGEPGCVNTATFTDPRGVERRVDVTVYKGNCLDRDPGDLLTVYYDAGDPSVVASSRAWWWPLLATLLAVGATVFLLRSTVRHVRGARQD